MTSSSAQDGQAAGLVRGDGREFSESNRILADVTEGPVAP